MAKICGVIGFGVTVDDGSGTWKEKIVTKKYRGDLTQLNYRAQSANQVNDNLTLSKRISIVADPYAMKNFHAMRYIEFMDVKWKVTSVELSHPRLIIDVGGVYNG